MQWTVDDVIARSDITTKEWSQWERQERWWGEKPRVRIVRASTKQCVDADGRIALQVRWK